MLNLETPADRLRALVRLRGREEGDVWQWFQGLIYGRADGEVLRAVCGFTAVLCVRYEAAVDGVYSFVQRESNHYTDLSTGEPVGEIRNPYTGKTNIAVGYVSPRFAFRLSAAGVASSVAPDKIVGTIARDFVSDATDIWTSESRANEYGAGISEEEFPEAYAGKVRRSADVATYRARKAAILDPSVPFVPSSLDFVADTPWMLWMMMGRTPGHMVWVGQGSKFATMPELPDDVKRRVEMVHPTFLADPWAIKPTAYLTALQMRALRAAGKI